MKKIEIYNHKTNETFASFETRKTKNIQKEVIKYLEGKGYGLLIKGKISPEGNDLYWSAYNPKTKEQVDLWYRECEKAKETPDFDLDITDSI